jgi:hypothetical protein
MAMNVLQSPSHPGLGKVSGFFWRNPGLGLFLLLLGPLMWFGIVYFGSLLTLLWQGFYTFDDFTMSVTPDRIVLRLVGSTRKKAFTIRWWGLCSLFLFYGLNKVWRGLANWCPACAGGHLYLACWDRFLSSPVSADIRMWERRQLLQYWSPAS